MTTKREAASKLIEAAGGLTGAYDTLRWFNEAGAYLGPEPAPALTPWRGALDEATSHLREVTGDFERRSLTLAGIEAALRDEIQTAQYQVAEYRAMSDTEEAYLTLLRGELARIGEALDNERADATKRLSEVGDALNDLYVEWEELDARRSVLDGRCKSLQAEQATLIGVLS